MAIIPTKAQVDSAARTAGRATQNGLGTASLYVGNKTGQGATIALGGGLAATAGTLRGIARLPLRALKALKEAAIALAKMVAQIAEMILRLFGIPVKIVERLFGGGGGGGGQQEEDNRENGRQVAAEDARQVKPTPKLDIDDPSEIKRVARQIIRGADIGEHKLSAPILMAIMNMPNTQLKEVTSSSDQQIAEFVASVRALTPPSMVATTMSAPTMQSKIAARRQGFQVGQLPTDPEP